MRGAHLNARPFLLARISHSPIADLGESARGK